MGRRRIAGKNLRIVSFNLDYDDLIKFEQILHNQSASEVIREFIRTRIEEHELEQNLNQLTNRRNAIGVQYPSAGYTPTSSELEANPILSSLDIMDLTTLQILEIVNQIQDTDILLELETKSKTIMKTSNKLRMQAVNYRIYQRKLSSSHSL
ncbi:MAG: hypothetical protein MRJ93_12900 [Nitrososphaeraceae archaeon]|nr:hypothetical protein [Nitrososphaeraceae archaeon]